MNTPRANLMVILHDTSEGSRATFTCLILVDLNHVPQSAIQLRLISECGRFQRRREKRRKLNCDLEKGGKDVIKTRRVIACTK